MNILNTYKGLSLLGQLYNLYLLLLFIDKKLNDLFQLLACFNFLQESKLLLMLPVTFLKVLMAEISGEIHNNARTYSRLLHKVQMLSDDHYSINLICAGDVNFSSDLSDLRHRKNLNVILVHNKEVHNSLTACANRTVLYDDLTREMQQCEKSVDLVCIHIKYITRKVWSKFKSMF